MKHPKADPRIQSELYRKHIEANESALISLLERKRNEVDAVFGAHREREISRLAEFGPIAPVPKGQKSLLNYPEGHCLEITRWVASLLAREKPEYLAGFERDGGHVSQNWGILRTGDGSRVFQNVLQIGNKIYDVAHEEAGHDEGKKVAAYPLSTDQYKNISSFSEYAEIREAYYHEKTYSSFEAFWGVLAHAVPVISLSERGQFSYSNEATMVDLNVRTGFKAAKSFLSSGHATNHPMPAAEAEHLRNCLRWILEDRAVYDSEELNAFASMIRYMAPNIEWDAVPFSHSALKRSTRRWHTLIDQVHEKSGGKNVWTRNEIASKFVTDIISLYKAVFTLANALRNDAFRNSFEAAGHQWCLVPLAMLYWLETGFETK